MLISIMYANKLKIIEGHIDLECHLDSKKTLDCTLHDKKAIFVFTKKIQLTLIQVFSTVLNSDP